MAGKANVTLYTRKDCCLCVDAKRVLEGARKRAGFDLEEIDIDADAELRK
jgi:glutaredoxin